MRAADLLKALGELNEVRLGLPVALEGDDGYVYDVVGVKMLTKAGGLDHLLVLEKSKRPRSN